MTILKLKSDEVQDKIDDYLFNYGPCWALDAAADSNKPIREVFELLGLEKEYLKFEDAAMDRYGICQNEHGEYYVLA